MDFRTNIEQSFKNLKKDIQELNQKITELSNKNNKTLDNSKNNKTLDNSKNNKIYTSKPHINQGMIDSVKEVFDSGMFVMGEKLREFERKFAEFHKVKHAIGVSNGTTAIELVLEALEIGEGDEIIVPSFTTMPTIEPIFSVGAVPVFVDIDPRSYTMDSKKIINSITKKTKAIMPVHLYGQPADIGEIDKICKKYGLLLIEDCCQAHNAKYNGRKVGTFGIAGCFSFYPTKNMTVLGDGGMIITNDDSLAKKIRILLNHGEDGKRYNHVVVGHNYRLSDISSAIGIKQLELLDKFTQRRREIARLYNHLLKDKNIILPYEKEYAGHVYHLYVIRVPKEKRDKVIEELRKKEIYCGIHYPTPCHMQKAVKDKINKSFNLPLTEKYVQEIISLPIYPDLTNDEIRLVASSLKNALKNEN